MSDELIQLDDPEISVVIRRSKRARRLTLTVPHDGGPPRVTAPPRIAASEIRMFLLRQGDWLRQAIDRAPEPEVVQIGAVILVAGRTFEITSRSGVRKSPFIAGDQLIIQGGNPAAAGKRIEVWLKEVARAALTPIAEDCADAVGGRIGKITIRDTKGRWGSCSSAGNLNFSWRLAMAPPAVLDYVAAHEAAHLIEMNHGPRFWALVEGLRPDWRDQRSWLRREGAALHRYRFSAS